MILNGREITFVKNESYRVRVECKAKCDFLFLCSKMVHKHTYVMKTLVDTHTCVRVLNNRYAGSKWMAKVVVKRIQTSEIASICDIMQDIRQNLSVGISVARAWRAKLIAKKIIERGVDKKYANLWRYVVELRRVNLGNTMKINIERPFPSNSQGLAHFTFVLMLVRRVSQMDVDYLLELMVAI